MRVYDIVIVGGNMAAMSAAIYSGMANMKTLQITYPEEKAEVTGVNRYLGYHNGPYEKFHSRTVDQLKKFSIEKTEQSIDRIVIDKDIVRIIRKEEEINSRVVIVSTDDIMNKIEGDGKESEIVFKCGKAFNDNTEMISLAGTGCMAAIDARMFLSK